MKKLLTAVLLMFFSLTALAQSPSGSVQSIYPLTRDLGSIKTLTAQTPATVTSADQSGYNVSRVTCVANIASKVGSSTMTFKIQNKDAASGNYYDVIESGTVTALATPTPISAGASMTTSANRAANVPIARTWRVSATISTATSLTGTIGCTVQ